MKIML